MLFRIDRFMYLSLAIQEIVSKATCESNKDTNKQHIRQDDLFPLHFTPILLRHFTVTFAIEKVFCFIIKTQ